MTALRNIKCSQYKSHALVLHDNKQTVYYLSIIWATSTQYKLSDEDTTYAFSKPLGCYFLVKYQ